VVGKALNSHGNATTNEHFSFCYSSILNYILMSNILKPFGKNILNKIYTF
jgi:hypothetical protein